MSKNIAQLTLEHLAAPVPGWVSDRNCDDPNVDMMNLSRKEVKKVCEPCRVRENCLEGAFDGEPVAAGWRGGEWMSKREEQPEG